MNSQKKFSLLLFFFWTAPFWAFADALQPGDIIVRTLGNEIWHHPRSDASGVGHVFFSPAPGDMWGHAIDGTGTVYFVYRKEPNEILAKVTSEKRFEDLVVLPVRSPSNLHFLADMTVGPTGNIYLAYRSQSRADCWLLVIGADRKAIDMQNGREFTGTFQSPPFPAGFGAHLAVNSKDEVYVAAENLGPETLYRAPRGSPLTQVSTIPDLLDIAFIGEKLWGSFRAGAAGFVFKAKIAPISLPASAASEEAVPFDESFPLAAVIETDTASGQLEVAPDGQLDLAGIKKIEVFDPPTLQFVESIPAVEINPVTGLVTSFVVAPDSVPVGDMKGLSAAADLYSGLQLSAQEASRISAWSASASTHRPGAFAFNILPFLGIEEDGKILTPTENDPVITSLGEYVSGTLDLNLGGPLPLAFSRYYGSLTGAAAQSRNFYPAAASPIGANWVHNFLILIRRSDASNVAVHYYNAQSIAFRKSGTNWQMNQSGLSFKGTAYQLVETDGKLKLVDPTTRQICTFDVSGMADGAVRGVKSIADRNGNTHTLTYNPDGTPKSVEDGLGRRLDFSYSPSGGALRISQVADQTGRSVRFAYSEADLTGVTDARGKMTSYTYSSGSLLASIKRPNGNTPLQNTYSGATPKVTSQADGLGATTRFTYNSDNTVIADPLGNARTHQFNSTLRLVRYNDEAGKSLRFSYDNLYRKTGTVSRPGDASSITYDAASGKVTSRTGFDGKIWKYAYSSQLQSGLTFFVLTRIDYPDGTRQEFSYNERGNLMSRKDRAGKVWTFTYNARGQMLTATNPEGGKGSISYNEDGTMASVQEEPGNLTTFGYDTLKRLNRVTRADGTSVQFTYDAQGNLLSRTNEKGKTTTFAYDDNNNLTARTDPLGKTWTFSYDANDDLVASTDPLGKKTTFTYDSLQRLKSLTDRSGNTTQYAYDARGRLILVTDPAGKAWTFTYDDDGIPTAMTNPLGHSWRFSSDKAGRITAITDPLSNEMRLEYDALSRVTGVVNPFSEKTSYTYDERSLMARASLPGPIATAYTRNALGRITEITGPRGKVRTHGFDNLGRLVSVTDPLGNVTRLTYDRRHRPTRMELPLGTLSVSYDDVGLITGLDYSDGTRLEYRYDDNNRLISATGVSLDYDANGRVVASNGITAIRNALGRIESLTLAPGKTVSYAYDPRNLLTSVTDWTGAVTRVSYDDGGRLTSVSRPNGVTATYEYEANRLIRIGEAKGNAGLSGITLTRDAKGQIRQANRDVPLAPTVDPPDQNFTHNDADQISSFSYDPLGRLVMDSERSHSWDLASRLTSYSQGESRVDFTYDALGRRLSRRSDGTTREFVWNHALALPSVSILREGGRSLRYYIHTPGGSLLYSVEEADNARRFYHYDEIGSTLFLTDDAGNITDRYAYSPLGQLTRSNGSSDNPFTFLGRMGVMRESASLYCMRGRYYDGATGRFLSRDPLGNRLGDPQSLNPYQSPPPSPLRLFFGFLTGVVAIVSATGRRRRGAALFALLLAVMLSCGDDKKTIIQGGGEELGNTDNFPDEYDSSTGLHRAVSDLLNPCQGSGTLGRFRCRFNVAPPESEGVKGTADGSALIFFKTFGVSTGEGTSVTLPVEEEPTISVTMTVDLKATITGGPQAAVVGPESGYTPTFPLPFGIVQQLGGLWDDAFPPDLRGFTRDPLTGLILVQPIDIGPLPGDSPAFDQVM